MTNDFDEAAEILIELRSYHRVEPDGSHTVIVEISGLPSLDQANRVSMWIRDTVRTGANQIGRLDPNPPRPQ